MPNRLAKASSPYLLQHQHNPVDWYEWGDEAFELAKEQNKPVFLSIGYATCHWCHVMAHESFEDEGIAELMNDAFINIKIDREERPDIDSTYMTVCQMITGHGGWPLSIVMTPEKKPFFAATYIPKEARFNRLGLRQLIPGIKGMWKNEPDRIQKAVTQIESGFSKSQSFDPGAFPGTEAIDYAAEQLANQFDGKWGGFGEVPKFPSPHNLMFLLRQYHQTKEERFLDAVAFTLTQMRLGGIWDHVGFGFHRYSTDREWLLPHFEKMLYDQALMMMVYTEAWQVTQNPLFKQSVYEIAEYVLQELSHPAGGFYSAEDADSEGEEGKFYVWEKSELDSILKQDSDFVQQLFEVKEEGNFEDEATRQLTEKNILHLKNPLSKNDAERWEPIRKTILSERTKRIRPLLDDKILTDWNGLMITAFAKAGAVFGEPKFIEAAKNSFKFIEEKLIDNKLLHRFKDGEAGIEAFADDYAFMIWAGIELYEATFDSKYLQRAIELSDQILDEFWDEESGGFFLSVNDADQPLGRLKQIYDGAIPSANSTMLLNLIKLARFTGNTDFEERANNLGELFSNELIRTGSSITMGMMALQFLNHGPKEIVIAEADEDSSEIKRFFHEHFIPSKVLLFRPIVENEIWDLAGFVKNQTSVDGKTTVYICEDYACELPLTNLEDIKKAVLK